VEFFFTQNSVTLSQSRVTCLPRIEHTFASSNNNKNKIHTMKKLIPLLFILLAASCKKEDISPDLVKEFTIQSAPANASYDIRVAVPENYDPSNKKYPTLYVLDGEENFSFVVNTINDLEDNSSAGRLLVVSIGYGNDRAKDYTPTKTDAGEGGAENFMHFIKDELIKRMETEFGADTARDSRIIIGHSFGGLFAAYAFTNYNYVFGNYIMLSPSLWYDNEILLRMEQQNRNGNAVRHQFVFMGLGGLESSGRMQAPYEAFRQRLMHYSNIQLASHIEPGLNHVGSKNPDIVEGLKFYFQNK
jgi:predicted alpha/beta superfamily hydrolase